MKYSIKKARPGNALWNEAVSIAARDIAECIWRNEDQRIDEVLCAKHTNVPLAHYKQFKAEAMALQKTFCK